MSKQPDLARDLANAENDLARLRGIVANTVAWIHDPAYDGAARCALAQRLGLPEPSTRAAVTPASAVPVQGATPPSGTAEATDDLLAGRLPAATGATMVQVLESKEG